MTENSIPMRIKGGEIRLEATAGQTVIKVVAPEHYTGPFEIVPSDEDQILPVKEKMPVEDITVQGITGTQVITENGTYDVLMDKSVTVDVPATGYDKGTLIYEGDFESATSQWAVTELPDGSAFSFDKIVVDCSNQGEGTNVGWRQYWRSDRPLVGNVPEMISAGVSWIRGAQRLETQNIITIEDDEYISLTSLGFDSDNPETLTANAKRMAHNGYDKITAYGWWARNCPAGTHIKITGYNRTTT